MGFHQRVPSGLFSTNQIVSESRTPGTAMASRSTSSPSRRCHGCGGRVTETAKSCFHCGRPLAGAASTDEDDDRLQRALTAAMTAIVIVGACSAVWFGIDLYLLNPVSEPVEFDQSSSATTCVSEANDEAVASMRGRGMVEVERRDGMVCFEH